MAVLKYKKYSKKKTMKSNFKKTKRNGIVNKKMTKKMVGGALKPPKKTKAQIEMEKKEKKEEKQDIQNLLRLYKKRPSQIEPINYKGKVYNLDYINHKPWYSSKTKSVPRITRMNLPSVNKLSGEDQQNFLSRQSIPVPLIIPSPLEQEKINAALSGNVFTKRPQMHLPTIPLHNPISAVSKRDLHPFGVVPIISEKLGQTLKEREEELERKKEIQQRKNDEYRQKEKRLELKLTTRNNPEVLPSIVTKEHITKEHIDVLGTHYLGILVNSAEYIKLDEKEKQQRLDQALRYQKKLNLSATPPLTKRRINSSPTSVVSTLTSNPLYRNIAPLYENILANVPTYENVILNSRPVYKNMPHKNEKMYVNVPQELQEPLYVNLPQVQLEPQYVNLQEQPIIIPRKKNIGPIFVNLKKNLNPFLPEQQYVNLPPT